MVVRVLVVLALLVFVLVASFCSAQVPKVPSWYVPSVHSAMSDNVVQSQVMQSGVNQQEGKLLQEPLAGIDQMQQQVHNISEESQLCEVDESSRVGCGEPDISPAECEALECCYDNRRFIQAYYGPRCYYGKAVTVQCTMDGQFVLVISKDVTIPSINLDCIGILEATGGPCVAVDRNDDFAIYQFPVTACGARAKVDGDYIVYENTMGSSFEVGFGPHGAITRDSLFALTVQCRYLATAVEYLMVDVETLPAPPPPPVVQQGTLRVELRLANGRCATKACSSDADVYSSYYTDADYPVKKVLRDPVYVEVRILGREDPNIALVLNHCWATSSPDSSSTPQWDLLVSGCPYADDHFKTRLVPVGPASHLQYPTHYRRFVVKMFTFVDDLLIPQKQQHFIHCNMTVCQLSDMESCELSCPRTRRSVSAEQDSGMKVLVSSGTVVFIDDLPVLAKHQADDHVEVSQGIGYGLYAIAALAVISIGVLLVAIMRRRPKHPRLQVTRL